MNRNQLLPYRAIVKSLTPILLFSISETSPTTVPPFWLHTRNVWRQITHCHTIQMYASTTCDCEIKCCQTTVCTVAPSLFLLHGGVYHAGEWWEALPSFLPSAQEACFLCQCWGPLWPVCSVCVRRFLHSNLVFTWTLKHPDLHLTK